MRSLEGKVAIVTGAGNGIGRAEASALARCGASVIVNDVNPDAAHGVAAEITAAGGRAGAVAADVALWDTGQLLVDTAQHDFGGLDIVVTNAGIVRRDALADLRESDFDTQLAVHLKGTFGLLHAASAHWRRQHEAGERGHRSAVLTSSSAGVPGGIAEFSVYGAAKAGIASLALAAAVELRPLDVTVNAILPHAATAMDAFAKGLDAPAPHDLNDPDPMNPRYVADVVAYLCSGRASWLTGQAFEISGTVVRRWLPWSSVAAVESNEPWTAEALDHALAVDVYGTMPGGRVIAMVDRP